MTSHVRDLVAETADLNGIPLRLVDTAGRVERFRRKYAKSDEAQAAAAATK